MRTFGWHVMSCQVSCKSVSSFKFCYSEQKKHGILSEHESKIRLSTYNWKKDFIHFLPLYYPFLIFMIISAFYVSVFHPFKLSLQRTTFQEKNNYKHCTFCIQDFTDLSKLNL